MSNDPFNTQKVKLDLMKELLQTEEQAMKASDVQTLNDLAGRIRWLKSKLSFYENGWHKVYQEQNNA